MNIYKTHLEIDGIENEIIIDFDYDGINEIRLASDCTWSHENKDSAWAHVWTNEDGYVNEAIKSLEMKDTRLSDIQKEQNSYIKYFI